MNPAKEQATFDAALDQYRTRLDTIPDKQFDATPPSGGWSYAEVYSHIMKANQLSAITMERCAHKNCDATAQKRSLLARLIFMFGRFPPARLLKVKVPKSVSERYPITKITKEEARNLLVKCRRQVDEIMQAIEKSSPEFKIKHPRLGMLNAAEWLKVTRIHTQHHLKQLDRIRKDLAR